MGEKAIDDKTMDREEAIGPRWDGRLAAVDGDVFNEPLHDMKLYFDGNFVLINRDGQRL